MVLESPKFRMHFQSVLERFIDSERSEAAKNLVDSYEEVHRLLSEPDIEYSFFPKRDKQLARFGMRWVQCGRYWFSFEADNDIILTGFFHHAVDIPALIAASKIY